MPAKRHWNNSNNNNNNNNNKQPSTKPNQDRNAVSGPQNFWVGAFAAFLGRPEKSRLIGTPAKGS
jgi:hypothetical protein